MTLPAPDDTRNWLGRTVVDRDGAEIGVCAALLTDTETGQPEWIEVERAEVTLVVPLLDAHESGGRVHVTVTRAYADGAPRYGATRELSRDQEVALYRHYGIGYSRETSDSLLPADAQPAGAQPATGSAAPDTGARHLVTSDAAQHGAGVAAAVAVILGLTAAVVAAVRRRGSTSPATRRLRRRAAPPPARARGPLAVPASALRLTDAATEAVVAAVPRVTAGTAQAGRTAVRALLSVGAAAEAVPEVVAETGERLEKGWRQAVKKVSWGLGFGAGYVLGARAGRARYEQIKQAAAGLVQRPEVRQALERARAAAPAPLQGGIDSLSRRSSSGPTDVGASPAGGTGAAAATPPPASTTGGVPAADAPLPDPLIPPARSGDTP